MKKNFHKMNILKKEIIIILIFLSLSVIFNLPKNIYDLITKNFDQRNVTLYDYCDNESIGFLNNVKKKYKNHKTFELYNYFISPNPSWFLENLDTIKNDKFKILLGYKIENLYRFSKYKNNFRSNDNIKNLEFIEFLSFFNKSSKPIYNSEITIITRLSNFEYEKIIYKNIIKKINSGFNKIYINQKFDGINQNIQLILKFKDTEHHKLLTNLAISKKNEFDIEKYQILEKYNNCYLIKNYD